MRRRAVALALASLAVTACASAAGAGPATLSYGVPATPQARYMTADTTRMDIDAMGQTVTMSRSIAATYGVAFARASGGVEVTLTPEDFSGVLSQPMGSPVSTEEDGIQGPLVFTLSSKGDVALVSQPQLSAAAAQVFSSLTTAYTLFPGLSGAAAEPGTSWVDTVSFSGAEGVGDLSSQSILTYEVLGDTVVAGHSLVKLDVLGTMQLDVSGSMQGTSFYQSALAGVAGHVLWDLERGLMYERILTLDGEGTVEADAMPGSFPLTIRGSSRARLVER